MKRSFFQTAVVSILLYGCTTWTLTKRLEKKLDGNYTRMLRAILNKSRRQHPTRHQLYGHLPPITKAGHCWRSKDELVSDVLLWTPTPGYDTKLHPLVRSGECRVLLHSYIHVHAEIYIYMLDTYRRNEQQKHAMIKTQEDFFIMMDDGFLYCILSASSLDLNSSGPQAPSAWCGFPYHISSITPSPTLLQLPVELQLAWLLSWLSYIIVQRPLDRPLDLWNRMFNRHQAEITVMQFRGHSLPVRQSMRVSWDFLARPISSANFRPRDFLS